MPKAFPPEFRRDVVAVARKGEAPIAQIAKDFGISESCLHRWLKLADVDDGIRPGTTSSESAELRELRRSATGCWSRRTRSCAGRRPTSPRTSPQNDVPAGPDLAADGIPVAVTCRVLGFTKQAFYAWRADPVIAAGLGRRAPDQRRPRHPRRRSGVRVPVHRRRTPRSRHHRRREPGRPALLRAAHLVGVRQEARA